jgi:hypothetical protein
MAKKLSGKAKVAIGAGAAAVALGAAGAFFMASKNAKGHRAKAKKLFDRAKVDVVREAKKLKKMSQADYERVVAGVMKTYAALKEERPEEMMHVANELKAGWKSLQKGAKKAVPKAKAAAKKAVKTAKKVVAKKATKKVASKKRA